MKLIIGLGNPGEQYKNTRHNTGFLVVDQLKIRVSSSHFPVSNQIKIFKSQNFMNESGSFVKNLTNRYSLSPNDLYIIHDDLDIKLGEYKIQLGRGPKDHNGLNDIYDKLGTNEFWHVRIGVDNRPLDNRPMGEEYVLQDFSAEEKQILEKVIKEVCRKLVSIFQLPVSS